MNIMQEALLRANVVTADDMERVKRQQTIEREQQRKRDERKRQRMEIEQRRTLTALASHWFQTVRFAPKLAADSIAREFVEGLTSEEVVGFDIRYLQERLTLVQRLGLGPRTRVG